MKLFEVDAGSARDVLAVLQGLANKKGQEIRIDFESLKRMANLDQYAISTVDALIALKNEEDPAGDVIKDISQDGKITIKTRGDANAQDRPLDQAKGPSIDSMANRAANKFVNNLTK